MSRFLFVVPPLTGHTNPTVSVADELTRRGHEVAWVGHPGKVRPLLPEGATLFALDDSVPDDILRERMDKARTVRGLAALKFMWEDFFLPLGRAMLDGVDAAVTEFEPDVIISDQQALAGGIIARRRGIPWATSATTSAGVTNPLEGLPKVKEWIDEQLDLLFRDAGLEPVDDAEYSPHAVLIFSSRDLVGDTEHLDARFHFVGPSIKARVDDTPFPWERLETEDPKVLVSLGTVNADRGARFYQHVVEALREREMVVVLAAPPELVPDPPANVIVQAWVPQLALLSKVDAVLTHGGHNTVCEALSNGLPLVVAPIKDDQPVIAAQIEAAGVGVRIRFGRVRPAAIAAAIDTVLDVRSYRERAQAIAETFRDAGGASAAADLLEGLV